VGREPRREEDTVSEKPSTSDLDIDTFEVEDYTEAGEVMKSAYTSSCSSSSTTSCTSCCA
jgi:thiazolylpeptide-type bacteriocin precursor